MSVGAFYSKSTAWLNNKPLEIIIPPDGYPFFSLNTTLDGVKYELGFKYAAREDRWYLTVLDLGGRVLVAGVKILADWPLLRLSQHVQGIPPGNLLAQDYSGLGEPPGRYDWGVRVHLLYFPLKAAT
jgi:hypothetical protein